MVAQNEQSIDIGNACHTGQRIKTKQKQAKTEHNVCWTPLSASIIWEHKTLKGWATRILMTGNVNKR